MQTFELSGQVSDAMGEPVAGAQLHFISDLDTLGAQPNAVIERSSRVCWIREVSGLAGHRWNCYLQQVAGRVAGITFAEFKERVVIENPALVSDHYRFQPEKRYWLPDDCAVDPSLTWDRNVTGFAGNRWQCWQRFVQGKVLGLSWLAFKDGVVAHNPTLAQDKWLFRADQQYKLPRNPEQRQYELVTSTDSQGHYVLTELPQGRYRVEVVSPQGQTSKPLTVEQDDTVNFVLEATLHLMAEAGPFVSVEGTRFMLNGSPWKRFVGVNLPLLLHYGDKQILATSEKTHQRDQLRKVNELGGRVIRVFLPHHTCDNAKIMDRLGKVLNLLEEEEFNDLYLLPAFIDLYSNSGCYPHKTDLSLDYHDFGSGDQRVRLSVEFFRQRFKGVYCDFVREVVSEFKDHRKIIAWEIGNELKAQVKPGVHDPAAFVSFCRAAAKFIKDIDPNHLVTTGMLSTQHADFKSDPELVKRLYALADKPKVLIDFMTVHAYYENEPDQDAIWAQKLGLPIIVEESGVPLEHESQANLEQYNKGLEDDLRRWIKDSKFQEQARLPAAGYMVWKFDPAGSGDRSGKMYHDFGVMRNVLGKQAKAFKME